MHRRVKRWAPLLGTMAIVAGALDIAQDAQRAFQQLLAGLGQADAAIGAGEQRDPKLLQRLGF